MRVKALVVAAMVITSVNAVEREDSKVGLGEVSLSQEPEPTKKKLGDGSGGGGKDPFCDSMTSKLSGLRDKAVALSYNIPRHR
ncbi:hypothetical protein BASA60_003167 [Batrachochytrium salamandrivorans]|nr:hypothetical protein BASA60_003167 [Batrachochytrium salamandrivorans]